MNVFLLGGGGREHALARKISESARCQKLLIGPGNAGTASFGTNIPLSVTDFEAIASVCVKEAIDLLVVGPEEPLVLGIVDYFSSQAHLQHIAVIGPSKQAAQLEGSKRFAKEFMQRHRIPTAAYRQFSLENLHEADAYIDQQSLPIVLKADGLAAGKGVLIINDRQEAKTALRQMILDRQFGAASEVVVIESFLSGVEFSVFVLTDGKDYVLLPEAKDYKRIGEGDTGLNTGGMGAVSPVPFCDEAYMKLVEETIVAPTIGGLTAENFNYRGFVFFGLIKTENGPKVIEYNCRLGDPETEVILPRLQSDLLQHLEAVSKNKLREEKVIFSEEAAATIVVVSGGYPGEYKKGLPVTINKNQLQSNSILFHAGTAISDTQVVTQGGRVFALTSSAATIPQAVSASLQSVAAISFESMYYRTDIGYEFK
ncbi:MAG: phosphoribosylamine--glycine ligase [Chitinophagales bacterium]